VRTQEVIELQTRTKFFGVLAVLLFAGLLAAPVSAADYSMTVKSDEGGIAPSFSCSIGVAPVSMGMMHVGWNNITSPNSVDIASNTAWSLTVKESSVPANKPANSDGRMYGVNTASGVTAGMGGGNPGLVLTNPMRVSVNGIEPALTTTAQSLHAGTPGIFQAPVRFLQKVEPVDPILISSPPATSQHYEMAITITGAAV
jgi:hypothetical protein